MNDGRLARGTVATLDAYLRRNPQLACVLISLPGGAIATSSVEFRRAVGLAEGQVNGASVSLLTRGLWRGEPMRLLRHGSQVSFSSETRIRRHDGHLFPCTVWARIVRSPEGRWVLLAFDLGADRLHLFGGAIDDPGVVIVIGDGATGIGDVTPNVTQLLGYDASAFIGMAAKDLIHPEDFASFLAAGSAAVSTQGTGSVVVRMQAADGEHRRIRVFLAPLRGHERQALAFVLRADRSASVREAPFPAQDVELRLQRIAEELAALGITAGSATPVPAHVASALEDLSPKRREIVRLLQDGMRVPGIARAMYLSQSAVRTHLSVVFRTFGVSSQGELLAALRDDRHRPT
jgi:PAS domain S-box-containing protein